MRNTYLPEVAIWPLRILIVGLFAFLQGIVWAGVPLLTYPAESTLTDAEGVRALSVLRGRPWIASVSLIAADVNAVYNNSIAVTLPSGQKRIYTKTLGEARTQMGFTTWVGGASTMESLVVVVQDGKVMGGKIQDHQDMYVIHAVGTHLFLAKSKPDPSIEKDDTPPPPPLPPGSSVLGPGVK